MSSRCFGFRSCRSHVTRVTWLVWLVWLVALVSIAACDDGSSPEELDAGHDAGPIFDAGSAPDRNAVMPADLCERLSTIQCAGEAYCCDAPGRSYQTCKKEMKDGCVKQLHLDAIAADPITGFDEARAETAFEEFEALAAACDPSVAAWGSSLEGLRGILVGSVAAGENCAPDGAAADPVISGAALASCASPETHACQPRSTQKDNRLNWTCDPRRDEDGPCFSDVNCKDGLYCANPQQRLDGKCRPRKAKGDACNDGHECESLFCTDNACVPATKNAAYCLD